MPIAAVRSGRPTERLNEEEEIEERSQVFFFFECRQFRNGSEVKNCCCVHIS